jgi:hypothetical protein
MKQSNDFFTGPSLGIKTSDKPQLDFKTHDRFFAASAAFPDEPASPRQTDYQMFPASPTDSDN